jgi:tetratricopeptide (TPR) repeat protein
LARYDEARALYRRALSLLTSLPDPSSDDIATLYHNLGGIEHAAGDYAAGEPLARRGLAIRTSGPGSDPRLVAADQAALAAILDGLGQYEESERLYLEALRVFEEAADDREIAVTLNGLGAQYAQRGRLDRAVALLERACALKLQALGARHPDLAVSLNNLGIARRRAGDIARATTAFAEAAAIFEETLGPEHPKTRICRANATPTS